MFDNTVRSYRELPIRYGDFGVFIEMNQWSIVRVDKSEEIPIG